MEALLMWALEMFILTTLAIGIGAYITRNQKVPSAKPSKFEMPEIEEGQVHGVIFGTPKFVMNPAIAWWGDISTIPIRKKVGEKYDWKYGLPGHEGRKNSVYQTIGYHYEAGIHFKLCHGPIDGVKQIRAGGKVVWPDPDDETELASDGMTSISINEPNLFGGAEQGGGIVGDVDIQYGGFSQTVNSYLSGQLGSNISANRGFVSVILKHVRMGTSPYPKAWSFLCKRTQILDDGSPQWYIAKANISGDINPAHMLRECYTNTRWGLGYSASLFDDSVWKPFADDLYTESFGVSRYWHEENESIEDLITDILKTISGTIYQDPLSGKFVPKLLRDDYDEGTLPTYGEGDLEVVEFGQPSYGEIPDKFYVRITDVLNNTVISIPDEDIAVRNIQGGKSIPLTLDFYAVTKPALAGKIAARERMSVTSMPATIKMKCKRTMHDLRRYDVFKIINYRIVPTQMIVSMVVRILEANYGTLQDGAITFLCTQDVFAMQNSIFAEPPATGWNDPVSDPAASPNRKLFEIPFWILIKELGLINPDIIDNGEGWLIVAAQKPSGDTLDAEFFIRPSPTGSFVSDGTGPLTPTATITAALPMKGDDVVIALNNVVDLRMVLVNSLAIIGNEIFFVKVINTATNQVTLARGILDTVPAAHSSGDRIWFFGTACYKGSEQYAATDTPGVKVCPRTAKGQLEEGSAPIDNASAFGSRAIRPYPPGNFKINSVSYPAAFTGEPTLTWAHRDRLQQIDEITEHDNGNIGPETNVTYTLKIYDEDNILARTESGLTGTSYTYTEANEISDCGGIQVRLRFVLYAVRAGYDSFQQYDVTVPRTVSPAPASAVAGKVDPTVIIT